MVLNSYFYEIEEKFLEISPNTSTSPANNFI